MLRRHGLSRRRDRLAVLEQQSADQTGLLSERTRRQVSRPGAADRPGDLCSLDTFYIGTLKGVGNVWPLTACEAASSSGWARVVAGEVTAATMAAFVREVVVPSYRAAGWRVRRVLTDNGKAFSRAFRAACAAQQIRHTRTKPRHAWTNGFVERVQGTIRHEHGRVAFPATALHPPAAAPAVLGPLPHPMTLVYRQRRVECRRCGIRTERVEFADPKA